MSRDSTAWSVKGIDQATRDIARRAAAASGMTIGEWIDHAIKADAANRGIPVPANQSGSSGPGEARPVEGIDPETVEAIFSRITDGERLFEARLRPIGYALKDVAERVVALERSAERLPPPDAPVTDDAEVTPEPSQPPVRIPISFRPITPPTSPASPTPISPTPITPTPTPDTGETAGVGPDDGPDDGPGGESGDRSEGEIGFESVLLSPDDTDDIWAADPETARRDDRPSEETPHPEQGDAVPERPRPQPIPLRPVDDAASERIKDNENFGSIERAGTKPQPPVGPPSDWRPRVDLDSSDLARSSADLTPRQVSAPQVDHQADDPADHQADRPGDDDLAVLPATESENEDDPTTLRERPEAIAPSYDFPADPIDTAALGLSGEPIEAALPPRRVASAGRLAIAAAIVLALIGGAAWTAHREGTLSLGAIGHRLAEAESSVHMALVEASDWVAKQIASGPGLPDAHPTPAPPATETAENAADRPAVRPGGSQDQAPSAESPRPEGAPDAGRSSAEPAAESATAPVETAAAPTPEAPVNPAPPLPEQPIAVDPRPVSPPPAPVLAEAPTRTSPAVSAPSRQGAAGTARPAQPSTPQDSPPLSRAEAGNPAAQFEVAAGMMRGANPRPAEAATWFREAAINGLAVAQFNLGVLYETGMGVPEDQTRALLWYHSAAEQGFALAQYNLGRLYAFGQGIPQSDTESKRWFQRAANLGVGDALYALATFETGELERERMMYTAAKAGAEAAQLWLRDRSAGGTPAAALGGPAGLVLDPPTGAPDVAEIQEGLAALGYYDGPIDGIAGPMTRAAIGRFQSDNGLPATGLPSRSLRQRLN